MNWLTRVILDRKYIADNDTVLDIGCGLLHVGIFGRVHLGIDGFRPALNAIAAKIPTLHGLAPGVLSQFVDCAYDVVLLLDVVEHLPREDAIKTILEAERIGRRRVVVFTPDGFIPRYTHDPLTHNDLQKHLCGFSVADFDNRGYVSTVHPNRSSQHGHFKSILATKEVG